MKRLLSRRSAAATLLLASFFSVPAEAGVSCHVINAKGVGEDLGGATTGNVIGGGLLHGTFESTIFITDVSGTLASFIETVTFTMRRATLTAVFAGKIDLATGESSASGPVTGSTGKLSGATGNLSFSGTLDLATGIFTEDLTGLICVDLAP